MHVHTSKLKIGENRPLVIDEPVEIKNNWLKFKTPWNYRSFKRNLRNTCSRVRNINLLTITPSLISQNPRDRMFTVETPLLVVTFPSYVIWVLTLKQTTKELKPHTHTSWCHHFNNVNFVVFHNITYYTNPLLSRIHVNITQLPNITHTLVGTSIILRSLLCTLDGYIKTQKITTCNLVELGDFDSKSPPTLGGGWARC